MGLCVVCVKLEGDIPRKEASMCHWSAQKGNYIRLRCKQHAIEGDIPRARMEAQRRRCPDGAKRQCQPQSGLIDVMELPDEPRIMRRMGPDWLDDAMNPLTFAALVNNGGRRWCEHTTKELDLTSGNPDNEAVAKHVMAQVVGTTAAVEAMSMCIEEVAKIIGHGHYQAKPCIGAVAVTNKTPSHQHAPLGV